jgi:hypothetical protein
MFSAKRTAPIHRYSASPVKVRNHVGLTAGTLASWHGGAALKSPTFGLRRRIDR